MANELPHSPHVNAEVPVQSTVGPAVDSQSWSLSNIAGDNPYFQAGFGLMGVGVVLSAARQGAMLAATAARRRLLVSLEMNNKDRAYAWFLGWMAHNSEAGAKSRSSTWLRSHQLSVSTVIEERVNRSSFTGFDITAGPGMHWFRYNGAWMQVKRERETRATNITTGVPWETVTITTLSRDRNLFPRLLAEARDLAMQGQEGKLLVHIPDSIRWRPFGQPRRKRPLKSVVLDDGVADKIERDIRAFIGRRQWYADRGIPYRRGYLLHGPPGSGKSSFIQAIAGELSYDVCVLNLSERGLGDDRLFHLLSNAPERSIILIEDIDAAFNKRSQTSEDGYQSSVTFSGLLNALDGVASSEERIIFMTTNHLEHLDPALIRPGRVDLPVLLDDASPSQVRKLFTQFYEDGEGVASGVEEDSVAVTQEELEALADKLEGMVRQEMGQGRRVSMAALQGLFILHGPRSAVAKSSELFLNGQT